MEHVTISKDKLLKKLKENRETHRAQFEEALKGWHQRVLQVLEKALEDARAGRQFQTHFALPQPADHTPEYDAVIDQVEWHEDDLIYLELRDFNKFIRDDWGWKADFLATNAMYTTH